MTDSTDRFFVQFREPGKSRWWYVGGTDAGEALRIRAAPHSGDREQVLAKYRAGNPAFEWRISGPKRRARGLK